jgi:hypothetical protein
VSYLSFRRLFLAAVLALWPLTARAVDEIQVYNAEIAEVGQWTIQQHLNYAIEGRKQPDFPGGIVPNHALNGTPELAYGVYDWWEVGFYAPFAASDRQFLSNGGKIRSLFVTPHADRRDFFYGVNFEFSYNMPRFSQQIYAAEIRPIIGWRNGDWEFIINPIVDVSFGAGGETDFAPAARIARKLGQDLSIGAEYYGDLGQIGNFLPFQDQQHTLYAVTDFKVGDFDVELGLGYGLTSGSDRIMAKTIIGYAFPVPGAGSNKSERSTSKTALTPAPSAHSMFGNSLGSGPLRAY